MRSKAWRWSAGPVTVGTSDEVAFATLNDGRNGPSQAKLTVAFFDGPVGQGKLSFVDLQVGRRCLLRLVPQGSNDFGLLRVGPLRLQWSGLFAYDRRGLDLSVSADWRAVSMDDLAT